jgi:copper homeostasis protein
MQVYNLEIACFDYQSAINAAMAGADRIEICTNYAAGGLTPDFFLVEKIIANTNIEMRVMIRPRAGAFSYSNEAFEQMQKEILLFKQLPINGFVFGILNGNNELDTVRNAKLIALAETLPCTLHRAFDSSPNYSNTLNASIGIGFKSILTSGGNSNAINNIENLKHIVQEAGNKIEIIIGGGIRTSNIKEIANKTKAQYFHSAAITDESGVANKIEINKLAEIIHQF